VDDFAKEELGPIFRPEADAGTKAGSTKTRRRKESAAETAEA